MKYGPVSSGGEKGHIDEVTSMMMIWALGRRNSAVIWRP